jgi:hypothetical protein
LTAEVTLSISVDAQHSLTDRIVDRIHRTTMEATGHGDRRSATMDQITRCRTKRRTGETPSYMSDSEAKKKRISQQRKDEHKRILDDDRTMKRSAKDVRV